MKKRKLGEVLTERTDVQYVFTGPRSGRPNPAGTRRVAPRGNLAREVMWSGKYFSEVPAIVVWSVRPSDVSPKTSGLLVRPLDSLGHQDRADKSKRVPMSSRSGRASRNRRFPQVVQQHELKSG